MSINHVLLDTKQVHAAVARRTNSISGSSPSTKTLVFTVHRGSSKHCVIRSSVLVHLEPLNEHNSYILTSHDYYYSCSFHSVLSN